MIHIGGKAYELVQEYRNGFNAEAFRDRFSEVLERYDYIVGDWGYNQLRLKGFFRDNGRNSRDGFSVNGIQDYLNEYCNFGCAYFIVRKMPGKLAETDTPVAVPVQQAAVAQAPARATGGGQPRLERHKAHHRGAEGQPSPAPEAGGFVQGQGQEGRSVEGRRPGK